MNIGELTATLGADIREMKRAMDNADRLIKDYEKDTNRSLDRTDREWRKHGTQVNNTLRGLERKMLQYGAAIGAALSVRKVAQYTAELTHIAGRYEMLGIAMNRAGENAGYSTGEMAAFENKLRDTGIAAMESRQSLTSLAASQIDLAKSSELARTAQNLAVVGAINSSEAFERMVHAIRSNSVEVLRTMGMNVSFSKSYEQMAEKLGKTQKELTEQEKLLARVNIVLQEGAKYQGIYENSMESAEKQMGSMQRHIDDYKVAFGKAFQPAYLEIVLAKTKYYKQLKDVVSSPEFQESLADTAKMFSAIYKSALDIISANLADWMGEVGKAARGTAIALTWVVDMVQGVSRTFRITGKTIALVMLEGQKAVFELADAIFNGPIDALNSLIEMYQNIPGLKYTSLGRLLATTDGKVDYSERGKYFRQHLEELQRATEEAVKDINKTMEEPFLGREARIRLREWEAELKKTTKATERSADEWTRIMTESVNQGIGEIGDGFSMLTDKIKAVPGKPEDLPAIIDPRMYEELAQYIDDTRTPVENLYAELERFEQLAATKLFQDALKKYPDLYNRIIMEIGEKHTAGWATTNNIVKNDTISKNKETISEVNKAWGRMMENIQDNTASAFRDIFDNGEDAWGNFTDGIVDIFKDTWAQIAAYYANNAIILPIVGQMLGAFGKAGQDAQQSIMGSLSGGGGGSSSSIPFSSLGGKSMPWNAWMGSAVPGMVAGAQGTAAAGTGAFAGSTAGGYTSAMTYGNLAGYGVAGSLGYQYLGGMLGLPQSEYSGMGAGIGSAGGAWASSALMGAKGGSWAGPVGAIAGAVIGGVLGGLLGDDDPKHAKLYGGFGPGYIPGQFDDTGIGDELTGWMGQIDVQGRDYFDQSVEKELEQGIAKYFEDFFENMDKTLGISIQDVMAADPEWKTFQIGKIDKYLREGGGGVQALLGDVTNEFFEAYAGGLAEAALGSLEGVDEVVAAIVGKAEEGLASGLQGLDSILDMGADFNTDYSRVAGPNIYSPLEEKLSILDDVNLGISDILNHDFFTAIQRDDEHITDTFLRAVEVLQIIPDSLSRMADLIEEGATRATAFEYLEQELEQVTAILTPAIQQGLSESAASLDFEDFKNGLTSNLQEQMKMAVIAAAQQDFMESIITSAFDEVGSIQDLLGDYFSGDLTLDEFTTQFDLAMDKIEEALSTEEFDRFKDVLEALGFAVEETTGKISDAQQKQLDSMEQAFTETIETAGMTDYQKGLYDLRKEYSAHQDSLIELGMMYDENGNLTDIAAKGLAAFNTEVQGLTNSLLNSIAKQRAQTTGDESYLGSYYQRTYGMIPDQQTIGNLWDEFLTASEQEILDRAESLGVDVGTYMQDLETAYNYYFGEVEDGTQIMNTATSSASSYNAALREQASLIQQQISNYQSIQGVIDSILGGEQGGPTSAAFMNRRYQELLAGAEANPEQVGAFTNFVQSKFLPFMQKFGGDYGSVEASVLEDLQSLLPGGGEKTLTDLYNELALVNEELARITQNTGDTVTAVQSIPSSGGGGATGAIEDIKQNAYDTVIAPSIALMDDISNVDQLRDAYAALQRQGEAAVAEAAQNIADGLGLTATEVRIAFKRYFGFAGGGTMIGPTSGYTVPTTFHGVEHIVPEDKMEAIIERAVRGTAGRMRGGGDQQIVVRVFLGEQELETHTVEVLRNNPEAQHQVRRIYANG